jgi:hypothetical protein
VITFQFEVKNAIKNCRNRRRKLLKAYKSPFIQQMLEKLWVQGKPKLHKKRINGGLIRVLKKTKEPYGIRDLTN